MALNTTDTPSPASLHRLPPTSKQGPQTQQTIMMSTKSTALALAAIVALSNVNAFSTSIHQPITSKAAHITSSSLLQATNNGLDTDTTLPSFSTKEEYTSYLQKAGRLPSGFAVGTAKGTFVSVEAPALGPLPIKATVIHLTEGPTDSWAAVFTSNRVSECLKCGCCFVA